MNSCIHKTIADAVLLFLAVVGFHTLQHVTIDLHDGITMPLPLPIRLVIVAFPTLAGWLWITKWKGIR